MTSAGDVIRQAETALRDTCFPPTLKEKEILTTILYQVSAARTESERSR